MSAEADLVMGLAVYFLIFFTAVRIIYDTGNSSKALGYLLLVVTLPVVGSFIYFTLGVNYRKQRIYSKKLRANTRLVKSIRERYRAATERLIERNAPQLGGHADLAELLFKESLEPLSPNKVTLLTNGEGKFPSVLEALQSARQHIHIEYYIYEEDAIGSQIMEVVMSKAREGVKVRFIYDDFGSSRLSRRFLNRLKASGVEAYPFYRVYLPILASRINYRNHRKIVVVDGKVGFVGGINVADRYLNGKVTAKYWRDTHVRIEGPAVWSLQYPFLADWNFCSGQNVAPSEELFPQARATAADARELVQIVAGGPDYPQPTIMLSYFAAIAAAKERVYLTSPYFIPNISIFDALRKAGLCGKDVRILVPRSSDLSFVDAASRSYFLDLLECGVKIYLYKKGVVHTKSLVVDDCLSIVGTANVDYRSFDLNFEINAVIYGKEFCAEAAASFLRDLEDSVQIDLNRWRQRSKLEVLFDNTARLFSPLL